MTRRESYEGHCSGGGNDTDPAVRQLLRDIQLDLGFNQCAGPPLTSDYDALVMVEGEPRSSIEQRQQAGHMIDTLFRYTYDPLKQEIKPLDPDFVRVLYHEDQEIARVNPNRDSYEWGTALAAAQKRFSYLFGVQIYNEVPRSDEVIERDRARYREVQRAVEEVMQQETATAKSNGLL